MLQQKYLGRRPPAPFRDRGAAPSSYLLPPSNLVILCCTVRGGPWPRGFCSCHLPCAWSYSTRGASGSGRETLLGTQPLGRLLTSSQESCPQRLLGWLGLPSEESCFYPIYRRSAHHHNSSNFQTFELELPTAMAPTPSRSQIKWPPKAFLNVLGYVQERKSWRTATHIASPHVDRAGV